MFNRTLRIRASGDNGRYLRLVLLPIFVALLLNCAKGRCEQQQPQEDDEEGYEVVLSTSSPVQSTTPTSFEILDDDDEQDLVWHDSSHPITARNKKGDAVVGQEKQLSFEDIDFSDPAAVLEIFTDRLGKLYNMSRDGCQSLWQQFYAYNLGYLETMNENLKIVQHSLAARFLTTFVPATTSPLLKDEGNENESSFEKIYRLLSEFFLYWPTLMIGGVVTLLALIIASLVVVRNNPQQARRPNETNSSWLIRTVCFLFAGLLSFFDVVAGSFRATESITYQLHSEQAAVYSIQGRRQTMEDCFTLKNHISNEFGIEYYAVYDGHGGANAALTAEKQIYEAILNRIKAVIGTRNSSAESSEEKATTSSNVAKCTTPKRSSFISTFTSSPATSCSSPSSPLSSSVSSKRFEPLTVSLMKTFLHEEVTRIDQKLVEQFRRRMDISGSTALIAVRLVHSNTLLVANVGDSRGIMCDWKGSTIPLSFDHKPYQLKEYRRIVDAGGYITLKGVYRVNGVLAVSRAIGDYPLKPDRLVIADPDILTFDLNELKPRFMVMASDGFWDTFSNEAAVRFVRNELMRWPTYGTEGSSQLALALAKKLVNEAYTRESYDNITVIVVLFQEETVPGNGGSPKIATGLAKGPSKSSTTPTSSSTPASS